jgi:hypothetical protein
MRLFSPGPAEAPKPRTGKAPVALALTMVLGLAAWAGAQSVAESSRQDKERRETLIKGGPVVVTNADLQKVKKKPAAANPGAAAPPAAGADIPAENPAQADLAGPEAKRPISKGQGAPARTAEIAASALEGNPRTVFDQRKAELTAAWATAKERIDLLNIKMLGLQQQMNAAVQPGVREQAQIALVETSKTLQDAQAAERKAREDLDRFTSGGK